MYAQIAVIYHHLKTVNGDNDPMPYKTWFLVLFIILGTLAFVGYTMLSAKSQKQYSAAMQQAQMQQLQMMQQGMQLPEGTQMTPEMQQAMDALNTQMTQMQNMQKPQ
jgi:type II secretory pathway pseudopilin PulG